MSTDLRDVEASLLERRARMRQSFDAMRQKMAMLREATDVAEKRMTDSAASYHMANDLVHNCDSNASAVKVARPVKDAEGASWKAPPKCSFRRTYASRNSDVDVVRAYSTRIVLDPIA
mmetsp:Transcript_91267/g.143363  ORF Transcript_91267/g.143363 Transcript_91267/m.143363 type:complete len:118 (+) Transcript_91267:66-419(+)